MKKEITTTTAKICARLCELMEMERTNELDLYTAAYDLLTRLRLETTAANLSNAFTAIDAAVTEYAEEFYFDRHECIIAWKRNVTI